MLTERNSYECEFLFDFPHVALVAQSVSLIRSLILLQLLPRKGFHVM